MLNVSACLTLHGCVTTTNRALVEMCFVKASVWVVRGYKSMAKKLALRVCFVLFRLATIYLSNDVLSNVIESHILCASPGLGKNILTAKISKNFKTCAKSLVTDRF